MAYYTQSDPVYTFNMSFAPTATLDPSSVSFSFVLVYPKGKGPTFTVDPELPALNGVGVGGIYASYTPSATLSGETTTTTPSGFQSTGLTWVTRTVTVTFTRIGSVGSRTCAGINMSGWTLATDVASGSQAQVSASIVTNAACVPVPGSTVVHKFTQTETNQTKAPYNANISDNNNDPIWTY